MTYAQQDHRIAVTGLGVLCALGNNPESVFARMMKAETGVKGLTRFAADNLQCSIAGQLEQEQLDAIVNDDATASMDLCARYAVTAARQALQDSGLAVRRFQQGGIMDVSDRAAIGSDRIGLALGTCNGGILSLEKQWDLTQLDDANTANYPFYQQGDDAAQALGLNGPVVTINTACAASGNAIGYASDMIRWGYADAMLAGGSDPLSHSVYAGFNVLRALNPLPSSPFGSRYGLNLGEGAAFVVLERLDKALLRGARIYGELCGYGLSNDAHHETAPHPEGAGIERAVAMALNRSAVPRERIDYINAHGTGTMANDAAEISGLKKIFGAETTIPISSSKAYFGHNLGAAAAVELVTALYAVKQGFVPGTLHYDAPREGCSDANIIGAELRRLSPQYMLSNNAAFGGHNVSLVLRTAWLKDIDRPPSSSWKRRSRVAITGIGAVGSWGAGQGGVLHLIGESAAGTDEGADGQISFSLKEYDKSKYERRMNKIAQFTIGAVLAAIENAGLEQSELADTGFIYGTSRGSTDSIARFLGSVFEKGPEYASSIYFPHTVINSIAGKTAEKLGLQGFNSSLSTGGSEGIAAALYGAGMIREGALSACLIGAGDERSELSDHIDRAKGLQESRYAKTEGSACIVLSDMDEAAAGGARIYAELRGFGISHGAVRHTPDGELQLRAAIAGALAQAEIGMDEIDLVLLNSIGRAEETEWERGVIAGLAVKSKPPVICLNDKAGYGESFSSMLHLAAAAELAYHGTARGIISGLPGLEEIHFRNVLTVSSSVNGSCIAAVVSGVR
ncbi:beta-ketoacyl-[acyl-carrier-protein] synthase family protein [Paenibacillus oenotherae]|uniref:Beta-ketoacyl-[acyl-carrier-protein] synthase family protein n=1 Tax=Paenibacillus oenotherae TaxID=1435645 RepID=A0ABS7D395_9BACL|nr:beta-ketoacyl-[acyl-carrier-protein] synthase family protein [Paenibacillus oenotherae]MBW7474042.1 beta-ketoacyl-[acyl-carrier-protein] synthase family protein [Paenibacillus oenotherae]